MEWYDIVNFIVGISALSVSIISIWLSLMFYFRTSELSSKMDNTLVEIKAITQNMYHDNTGMLKDMIQRAFENKKTENQIADGVSEELAEQISNTVLKMTGNTKEDIEKELKLIIPHFITEALNEYDLKKRVEQEKVADLLRVALPFRNRN
ncbi:MAG: hypothetical protein A4E55_01196 [Pelotomaculum sp. PtaU1.Bin035]|nr:MAG: hypothetical protein A4E55_01196 [Pelotomaculum sp. PtaU1.Bin035]